MPRLSDLNKRERKIRTDINRLRAELRKKNISKKDFDADFEKHSKELEQISKERDKLIGMPPMPPPPMPPRPVESGLGEIKSTILGAKTVAYTKPVEKKKRPPKPPQIHVEKKPFGAKPARPLPKEEEAKPVPDKVLTAEVPVIKERIREVPVIKEVVKEVRVPVVKEVIKKVPVIKKVKVPSNDPSIAKRIEENIKILDDIKADLTKSKFEQGEMEKEMVDIKKRLEKAEEMKVEITVLNKRIDLLDFQGLSKDIYSQFEVMKKFIGENVKVQKPPMDPEIREMIEENRSDIRSLQNDLTRNERKLSDSLRDMGKAADRIRQFDVIKSDVSKLRTRVENLDFRGISKEIYGQFEKMNGDIRESEKRVNDLVEKMNVEMKTLNEKVKEAQQAKEHVDNLEIPTIRRDMETLKQKNKYIETHIERVDVEPIVKMIREMENKIENLKASSVLVIE